MNIPMEATEDAKRKLEERYDGDQKRTEMRKEQREMEGASTKVNFDLVVPILRQVKSQRQKLRLKRGLMTKRRRSNGYDISSPID